MSHPDAEYVPPKPLPKKAYLKNIGVVQILGYHRDGYFHVLDNRDTRRLVHRQRLSFRK